MAPRYTEAENQLIINIALASGNSFPRVDETLWSEFCILRHLMGHPVRSRSSYIRQLRIIRHSHIQVPIQENIPIVTQPKTSIKRQISRIYTDEELDEIIEHVKKQKKELEAIPVCVACKKESKNILVYSCGHPICIDCFLEHTTLPLNCENTRSYSCCECYLEFEHPTKMKYLDNATNRDIKAYINNA